MSKDFERIVGELKDSYVSGATRSYEWRIKQLKNIVRLLSEQEDALVDALKKDNGKPDVEARMAEIIGTKKAAGDFIRDLKSWMQPVPHWTFGLLAPASAEVRHQPYGVALILGPFNYPVSLVFKPLLGAIAAGNCAVIKPSDMCPEVTSLLEKIVPQYLDSSCVRVVNGGIPETTALLKCPFDFIFFTGSHRVGKIVAKAAAELMVPSILELGGKNVAIVDSEVQDLAVVANRIMWGRTYNSGQSCIAPDYVLCLESQAEKLKDLMVKALKDFYGDDPKASKDFGRIQTKASVERISKLLDGPVGSVLAGGQTDPEAKYVAPTILSETPKTAPIMQEELFAPVISIITVKSIEEAIKYTRDVSDECLAFYVFSSRSSVIEQCISNVRTGSILINDTMFQEPSPNTPFGGIGKSGMGTYHGKYSFEAFTQKQVVIYKHLNFNNPACDPPIRYPPFDNIKARVFRVAVEYLPALPPLSLSSLFSTPVLGILLVYLLASYNKLGAKFGF